MISNSSMVQNRQMVNKLKIANRTVAILLIVVNSYFSPFSFTMIKSAGGAFSNRLLGLLISFSINLLLIPAGLTFKKRFSDRTGLLIINILGFLWSLFWLWLFLSIPKMD